jgi:hypothetical protein
VHLLENIVRLLCPTVQDKIGPKRGTAPILFGMVIVYNHRYCYLLILQYKLPCTFLRHRWGWFNFAA